LQYARRVERPGRNGSFPDDQVTQQLGARWRAEYAVEILTAVDKKPRHTGHLADQRLLVVRRRT
tara:strand:+ start:405 stop:596 length:192 start_codon:yes stop_codon:yes gene_type:complete